MVKSIRSYSAEAHNSAPDLMDHPGLQSLCSPTVAIASWSLLQVPVGAPGRALTSLGGGNTSHEIVGGSFASSETRRTTRYGQSERDQFSDPQTSTNTFVMETGPIFCRTEDMGISWKIRIFTDEWSQQVI